MYTKYANGGGLHLLLSDGTGLTSRQVATQAAAAGHVVEVLAPTRFGLGSLTRHVRRVHHVPPFGAEPEAWLEAALAVITDRRPDVLVPTQEQVALLARERHRISELGVAVAVPSFGSVLRVQDKVAQLATLQEVGLAHPSSFLATTPAEVLEHAAPPVYLKLPVGTASRGVWLARDRAALSRIAASLDYSDGVVVQARVDGPLIMVQAVFDHGRLVAWHACQREREGTSGGASVKRSVRVPQVGFDLPRLGSALEWHGALSLDVILTAEGPRYIDLNPRLVEPGNAWRAGCDLVSALVAVSVGKRLEPQGAGTENVRTHQTLLAVLGAAERDGRRRAVARELGSALLRRGPYANSREELTPCRHDAISALPVLLASASTLLRPASWRWFTGSAVSAYALTPDAFARIRRDASDAETHASPLGDRREVPWQCASAD